RRGVPAAELARLELADRLLQPVRGVRAHVAIGPAARRRLHQPGTAALADRGAEARPGVVVSLQHVRGRTRNGGLDLVEVLEEMAVRLARDETNGHEVDVAVRE